MTSADLLTWESEVKVYHLGGADMQVFITVLQRLFGERYGLLRISEARARPPVWTLPPRSLRDRSRTLPFVA